MSICSLYKKRIMEIQAKTLTRRLPIRMDAQMDDKVAEYSKLDRLCKAAWIRSAIAEKIDRRGGLD